MQLLTHENSFVTLLKFKYIYAYLWDIGYKKLLTLLNMISCISKINHKTKIRWNVSHDNDYIEDNSRALYK